MHTKITFSLCVNKINNESLNIKIGRSPLSEQQAPKLNLTTR
jgi:hypothetical protein